MSRSAASRESPADLALAALQRQPWPLLAVVAALLTSSLILVHSASYVSATGTYAPFAERQVQWIIAGAVAYAAIQMIPYPRLLQLAPFAFALGIAALLMVFVIGTTVNGSRRWFSFGSVRIQPSEFMKLALAFFLARIIGDAGDRIRELRSWVLPALLTATPFVLVLKQPDLGTALIFVPILAVLLFLAGARLSHLAGAITLGLAAFPIAWRFVFHDYQKERVLSFLNPKAAAQDGAYQQLQGIIGIGSGGLLGTGYEQGTQGRLGFCPERHTDFIFSVLGEEFGLVGGLLMLALQGALVAILLTMAPKAPDRTGRLLIAGIATVFAMQLLVNVAMNTGCGPITGLTLPFVSYGGSSMLSSAIGLGLAAAAWGQPKRAFGA